MTAIAAGMQAFFTQRLIQQRRVSPHTVAAYRDELLAAGGGDMVAGYSVPIPTTVYPPRIRSV